MGEGGGQVLRSALSLSLVTGRPFRISRIRARRDRPGLRRQHLAAVRAAAAVGSAEVEGAELDSRTLVFRPRAPTAGTYEASTDGAGSTTLVFETLFPALLAADGPSRLRLDGGTHNPFAPPFEFLDAALLPLIRRAGYPVDVELERHGFYPAGGGRLRARVEPSDTSAPLTLHERGAERSRRVRAVVSALPRHIAEREASIVHAMLGLRPDAMEVVEIPEEEAAGPGNAVMILVEHENVTEVFTGFGEKGVPAEEVAAKAAREAGAHLESGVPVGPRLADQLLVPLAAGPGGEFDCAEPTAHTRTAARVVARFLGTEVEMAEIETDRWRVGVPGAGRI